MIVSKFDEMLTNEDGDNQSNGSDAATAMDQGKDIFEVCRNMGPATAAAGAAAAAAVAAMAGEDSGPPPPLHLGGDGGDGGSTEFALCLGQEQTLPIFFRIPSSPTSPSLPS